MAFHLESYPNDNNGNSSASVSILFVIFIVSTVFTALPVVAKRVRWMKIPLYVYLFIRYFGANTILATALIHLLDSANGRMGPDTYDGIIGNWTPYSWYTAIVLMSIIVICTVGFGAQHLIEVQYGAQQQTEIREDIKSIIPLLHKHKGDNAMPQNDRHAYSSIELNPYVRPNDNGTDLALAKAVRAYEKQISAIGFYDEDKEHQIACARSAKQQITAFLTLEFRVLFHSVIVGLTLGIIRNKFSSLYWILLFRQPLEGLGIGARLCAVAFKRGSWLPWILCALYALTTPVGITVGLAVHNTYDPGSFTAGVVAGVLDSMSTGSLIYTGLMELLAAEFMLNPPTRHDNKRLALMLLCAPVRTGLVSLLWK
ncbi:high-affinity Zn(2+) transporter zrt1 [Xylographa bjoerkii]|nr:high-affinity Zn(2+) transporter zrt1 [Xylographa bjoerkii]